MNQPHTQDARGGGNIAGGASIQEGNVKLLPWLMMCAIFSGFSLAAGVFCYIYIHDIHASDREDIVLLKNENARMAVHIMSNDALLLRERIIQPGDMYHGPEGNLDYGRRDQPRK